MSTAPFTQGRACAPAARRKLSFLDRFLTLWIVYSSPSWVGYLVPFSSFYSTLRFISTSCRDTFHRKRKSLYDLRRSGISQSRKRS